VHETRKHLKKARSALRLVRGEIEREVWKREDRCLGKVGQLISEVRDAEVRLQTVRQLREFARGKRRSFEETEELLAFELDGFLAAFSGWPEEAEKRLRQALERIREWPLNKLNCKRLRENVQRTYKRGRKALKRAIKKTSAENLHTFRKREKELWYQLRLLRPLAPAVFKELNDELKTIGQYLGQVHDLAFVGQRLSSSGPARKQGHRILNALIESRTEELQYTAIALGERFYAEAPGWFARRIAGYFSDWETTKRPGLLASGRGAVALN
jgi:CHAD domain-containing protein